MASYRWLQFMQKQEFEVKSKLLCFRIPLRFINHELLMLTIHLHVVAWGRHDINTSIECTTNSSAMGTSNLNHRQCLPCHFVTKCLKQFTFGDIPIMSKRNARNVSVYVQSSCVIFKCELCCSYVGQQRSKNEDVLLIGHTNCSLTFSFAIPPCI